MKILIFITVLLYSMVGLAFTISCKSFVDTLVWTNRPSEIEIIRRSWGPKAFTDPGSHDPLKFRYLVRYDSRINESFQDLVTGLKNPSQLFSFSMVDQSYRNFFSKTGFIARVMPSNVIASGPYDLSTGGWPHRSDAMKYFLRHGLQTPANLMEESMYAARQDTSRHYIRKDGRGTWANPDGVLTDWNEVLIQGGPAIEIVGLFVAYQITSRYGIRGTPEDRKLLDKFKQTGLPVVAIPGTGGNYIRPFKQEGVSRRLKLQLERQGIILNQDF